MSDGQVPQSVADSSAAPPSISSANIHPFLDISPDALVIVDRNGNIVLVNGQTEAVFGYARSELLGQPLELLLPQRFHAAHASYRERYFSAPRTRPMGIGLNLVRGLVELHGGRVEAHSGGPGQGSEFVVRLPVAEGA